MIQYKKVKENMVVDAPSIKHELEDKTKAIGYVGNDFFPKSKLSGETQG